MGGNKINKKRQIIAFGLSFLFIYIFHGQSVDIKIWAFGNFLTITFELLFKNWTLESRFITNMVRFGMTNGSLIITLCGFKQSFTYSSTLLRKLRVFTF
jgi:hypothetical protein